MAVARFVKLDANIAFFIIFANIKDTKLMNVDNRKLVRSDDRMIAGVCGGIADFFGLDPSTIRVAYFLLTLFTAFSGIPVYIVLWLIIPDCRKGSSGH